jgi:hypothetical protein
MSEGPVLLEKNGPTPYINFAIYVVTYQFLDGGVGWGTIEFSAEKGTPGSPAHADCLNPPALF